MSGRKAARTDMVLSDSMRAQLQELQRRTLKVEKEATSVVEGLLEPPVLEDGTPNPKYNPDAAVTKAQCSMRTWASLQIYESMRKDARTATVADASRKPMGVVVIQDKLSPDEWQAQAQRWAKLRAEKEPNRPVIDVEVKGDGTDGS